MRPAARFGLATRLLLAIAIVLATAAATAWVVVSAVGPAVFHEHLMRAGIDDHAAADMHAEEAFRSATTVASAIALVAAAIAATAVSLVLTRRIGGSLAAVSTAATSLGAGHYEVRVPSPGLGAEFDDLSESFNRLADRLEEAQRLRGRLLADLAHEVRTPVATITGYLEAVEDGVQPLDATTLAVLREQADRLTRLAQDLAAVTHAEAGDVVLDTAPTRPADIVEAAVLAAQERALARGIALSGAAEPGLPSVRADRHRMSQVLDNLLANALRHTPSGGQITVSAARGDGGVRLVVTDTGEGIAAEHLPHVFDRFYRVGTARDRASGGSGIGLAISKALVEAHGGSIRAASAGPGRGATFTVTLPAA
ncbi:HAMP domain-containing sensor histidine kinase [Cellulomonas fimi]|uniref:histidine kinase n=1 Tax=Cellulomonas fimi (strain ATCC 484 / DSM 20113 / JCM 1341 / CCUG 24087 / LMG 16345 / NBRC 15513 / NCIMB 8980 / NCTC 7547 / NRS-133) TaxID=590998 RepID=F4H0U4_CELFA|nr:HAMP domain-containing sensor histidine kinase [Cellulomonas fimi]AEE46191.1 integral membrane sensor signal transduction histidine kinase [Cellulomonas fimi ATCC 484]NNH07020.1 HAMP domain-containing histidine kinase [Cellulomonas fimi]VEH31997.1 Signal transduction histidine-protein kinase BaeS [Cellulomonas fimi]